MICKKSYIFYPRLHTYRRQCLMLIQWRSQKKTSCLITVFVPHRCVNIPIRKLSRREEGSPFLECQLGLSPDPVYDVLQAGLPARSARPLGAVGRGGGVVERGVLVGCFGRWEITGTTAGGRESWWWGGGCWERGFGWLLGSKGCWGS